MSRHKQPLSKHKQPLSRHLDAIRVPRPRRVVSRGHLVNRPRHQRAGPCQLSDRRQALRLPHLRSNVRRRPSLRHCALKARTPLRRRRQSQRNVVAMLRVDAKVGGGRAGLSSKDWR